MQKTLWRRIGNQELTIYTIEFYEIIKKKTKIKIASGKVCTEFVINTIEMAKYVFQNKEGKSYEKVKVNCFKYN